MNLGGLFLNNPRLWGYLVLASMFILGALTSFLTTFLFRRRLFARSLVSVETEENRRLSGHLKAERAENGRLRADNAVLRATITSIKLKVSNGIAVIQSAFNGMEADDVSD